ncbi:MAG: DUF2357 domain-containing protein [Clostridia bacterium]|nr:DUF2357 domain-containing protein [Clostridia bacterium]
MADKSANEGMLKSVYDDATYYIDSIVSEYGALRTILDRMGKGEATVELRKRYFLRAIDETWVNAIEDALPALDTIIRNPSKFIEDQEELVNADQARKITVRTLQHLSQHTNLIQSIDGDMIIPKKLLNVYKEETMQTYENKFINTLINRLYVFVNRRYEIALRDGQDEKTTSIDFKDDFDHDKIKVRMHFRVEIAESADDNDEKVEQNYSYTTDIWRRVKKLNNIVTTYAESEFARQMGHSYIRPPVMKTNAILKNKNLRQCLELWRFIENYDSAGYSMLIQENLENIDEEYIKELYSTVALQYMIFRYKIKNEFDEDSTLASEIADDEFKPKIVDELGKLSGDEFNVTDVSKNIPKERFAKSPSNLRSETLTPEDRVFLDALDVAMDASDIIRANGEEFIYSRGNIEEPGGAE